MKFNKFMMVAMFVAAIAMVGCKKDKNEPTKDNQNTEQKTDEEEEEELELPAIDAPAAGKITFVVHAPKGTCNGIIAVGAGFGEGGTDDWAPADMKHPFEAVADADRWYSLTVDYVGGMALKVCAVTETKTCSWGTQWGMNVEGAEPNVILLKGDATIDNSENKGEVKLVELADGGLYFIDVKAWKSEPCTPKNEAGVASFKMTSKVELPEGVEVGIVGAGFEEVADWDINNPIVLELKDGAYVAEGVKVKANCEYKYFLKFAEEEAWSWDHGCQTGGGNIPMALNLKAEDTIEGWDGLEEK